MTNQELINKAALELSLIESGGTLDATESADAMDILNRMMSQWRVSSKDVQYFPQDTLSDTTPIPDWAEQAVIVCLAGKMASSFGGVINQTLAIEIKEGLRLVEREVLKANLESANMSHMPQGSGKRSSANILTGI